MGEKLGLDVGAGLGNTLEGLKSVGPSAVSPGDEDDD